MEDMKDVEGVEHTGGLWCSTVRVSGEVVRSNAVPVLQDWAHHLMEALGPDALEGGSIALRQIDHLVVTAQGTDMGNLQLDDFVEVVEYDPVRHVALVIGLRDAPRSTPLLWLLLKVFPGSRGVAVLPRHATGDQTLVRREIPGSFDEAMAIAETVKERGREGILGPALETLVGMGTVVVVPPEGDPLSVLRLNG
jgi:hypothetical protein